MSECKHGCYPVCSCDYAAGERPRSEPPCPHCGMNATVWREGKEYPMHYEGCPVPTGPRSEPLTAEERETAERWASEIAGLWRDERGPLPAAAARAALLCRLLASEAQARAEVERLRDVLGKVRDSWWMIAPSDRDRLTHACDIASAALRG